MPRKLRVSVDLDICVGNAMCETYAPKVFVLNDDRQSTVADPNADTFENIMEAAQDCPVSAITVIDDETGESLFP
ncbi:MAG TPA: ferredoxin [Dehalococcoidia bacterium]|jgi:ferredoxin|nr:ferredoxin [Dehalococcoidia bacterium]MCS5656906.1 ferredoxin [Dehalococcoidia bacterium]HIB13587.1 ferredoxin [Dehalococcoidia bacterium]HIM49371.1 ferredoxin [Dehalococcoidia bacterium]|tara:strand:+ start:282 stop:506 length:225 start_codon:yes stop_codon:yes gene_type:complete